GLVHRARLPCILRCTRSADDRRRADRRRLRNLRALSRAARRTDAAGRGEHRTGNGSRRAVSMASIFDRRTPPHILTLVLATATGSLSMNVFLPSLPGMARHFDADYGV